MYRVYASANGNISLLLINIDENMFAAIRFISTYLNGLDPIPHIKEGPLVSCIVQQ